MEGRAALWTLVGTLVAFKAITILLIVLMYPSTHSVAFMILMNWYWVPVLAILLAGPVVVWFRLLRGRAKRAKLLREEWHLDDGPPGDGSWLQSERWQQFPESQD